MNIKIKLSGLLVSAIMVASLVGCGSDSSSSATDEDISSSSELSSSSEDLSSSSKNSSSSGTSSSSTEASSESKDASSSSAEGSSDSKENSSSSVEESSSSEVLQNSVIVAYGVDAGYQSGELTFGDETSAELKKAGIDLGSDIKLVANGKYVYALAPSNVTKIDASKLSDGEAAVSKQQSIGDYAYPYDIAFIDETSGWLVLNGRSSILKLNLETLAATDSIDISAFAATTEAATASAVAGAIVDGKLVVLIGRLDNYVATKPGLIAVFDAESGEFQDTIPLNTYNPMAFAEHNGKLLVATQGTYNASYGADADELRGLEEVDLSVKKATVLAYGTDFGGGLYKLAVDNISNIAYVAVYKSYGDVPLVSFNLGTKKISTVKNIADAEGAFYWSAFSTILYVGDRSYGASAFYAYDGKNLESLTEEADALPSYSAVIASW